MWGGRGASPYTAVYGLAPFISNNFFLEIEVKPLQDGTTRSQVDHATWASLHKLSSLLMSGFADAGFPYNCISTCGHDVFLQIQSCCMELYEIT
jgi:hypothetical protein